MMFDIEKEGKECHFLQRNNSFRSKGKCQNVTLLPILKDDKKGQNSMEKNENRKQEVFSEGDIHYSNALVVVHQEEVHFLTAGGLREELKGEQSQLLFLYLTSEKSHPGGIKNKFKDWKYKCETGVPYIWLGLFSCSKKIHSSAVSSQESEVNPYIL